MATFLLILILVGLVLVLWELVFKEILLGGRDKDIGPPPG